MVNYGPVKGAALSLAYKYGIGRRAFQDDIASVLYKCAKNPTVRAGAIDVLDKLADLPDTTIEFYGRVAFPGQEYILEKKYRAIAPCMNAVAHYELVSPFASQRKYLRSTTRADDNTMNYILGTSANDLRWPARWRIVPVVICGTTTDADIRRKCSARVFQNLHNFHDYVSRRR